jgi:hypothetical protein
VILDLETLSATNHNGGAIHFGPDGKLYVATGENAVTSNAQTLSNRLGKILRINADGTIPTDNPFFGTAVGVNRAIWALGLRNPFTFAFQAGTGRMFINDVGAATWEEINDGIAGSNYGWPSTEGPTGNPAFRSPLFSYGHGAGTSLGCAISGGAFYPAATQTFPPGYTGDYFFADWCSGWIRRFDPTTSTATLFATGIDAPVDLKVHPDGSLYYLAQGSGQVYRVHYHALEVSDATVDEGSSGATDAIFTVTLSAPSTQTVSVSYATSNGTAIAGQDYTGQSGILTFPVGEVVRTVAVAVTGDTIDEADETFFLNLSSPVGTSIGDGQGVGTILDDDPPPAASINDAAAMEGASGVSVLGFVVSLSVPSGRTVSVTYSTADGSARAGSDYVASSGTLVFPAGTTALPLPISIVGDTRPETDETFLVQLIGATNATLGDPEGVGTIVNDDLPAARVFLSVIGSDLNTCSNPAMPCRTFDEAIGQVAADGEVIVQHSGSYGAASIGKAVKLHAPHGVVAFTASTLSVSAGPSDVVVLRGLTVKSLNPGTGSGVLFTSGAALFVEDCLIDGWDRGIDFVGDGSLFLTDTTVRNSASAAVRLAPPSAASASIDRSRLEGTSSGCGLDVMTGAMASVRGSVAAGNAAGICSAGGEASVHGSVLAHNPGTGLVVTGGIGRLSASLVTGNGTGLDNAGGILESIGNSLVRGNSTETSGTVTTVTGR